MWPEAAQDCTIGLCDLAWRLGHAVGLGVSISTEGGRELTSAQHPRYLALDIGSKRIGVAVSDELGITAQPVLTLTRRSNTREDLRSLGRLCRRFGVVGIVVGHPLHLSGEVSQQAMKTQAFAAQLQELTHLPLHAWDERLTSHEAHQILYEAGYARQDHASLVDQVAAVLILESFLRAQEAATTHADISHSEDGNPEVDDKRDD